MAMIYALRLKVIKYTDSIICLSNLEKSFLLSEFDIQESRIQVIPNSVNILRFDCQKGYDFKEKFGISDLMILYVGQLIQIKGIFYLLNALSIIKERGLKFVLVIITYNNKEDIRSLSRQLGIQNNIILLDYNTSRMNDNDLIAAYKSCDIVVLPSLAECLPTVLLEAMASKKPIVATRVGGNPELVIDGHNGYLCDPFDSRGLAEKIMELEDQSTRESLGQNGYNIVKLNYDWNKNIDKIQKVYQSLIC